MGQQQLLLIVLTVIIVGIAVVVGINMFSASSTSANRDAIVSGASNLGAMAQQYYRKPKALAGGGNSFKGWTIPSQLASTASGTYTASGQDSLSVTIVGIGTNTGNDGSTPVQVTVTVFPNSISTKIDN